MKYRKIAGLGKGGMAVVSLATARGPGDFSKLVVIKELRGELAGDPEFLKMFLDEARISARLQHPNIVHTYDVVSEDEDHFLVMEYLEGEALSNVRKVDHWQALPLGLHLKVISDALGGLHYAHELKGFAGEALGVIHRDVSPQNILVQFDGQVKLLDFGVAKVRGALATTSTGVIKGKLAYVAPEVLRNEAFDRRADVFSAGVLLWEAMARRKISLGRSDAGMVGARVGGFEPPVTEFAPDAPKALVEICARAMANSPSDRFPTALALKEAIDAELPQDVTQAALGAFVSDEFASRRLRIQGQIQEFIERPHAEEELPTLTTTDASQSRRMVMVGSQAPESGNHANRGLYLAVAVLVLVVTAGGSAWLLTWGSDGRRTVRGAPSAPLHSDAVGSEGAMPAVSSAVSSASMVSALPAESTSPSASGSVDVPAAMSAETPSSTRVTRPPKKVKGSNEWTVPKGKGDRPTQNDETEASGDKARPIYESNPYDD